MDKLAIPQQQREQTSELAHDATSRYYEILLKETALIAYEQAIQLAPREAVLYYHKGQVLEQLGKADEAQLAYAEARRLGY